MPDDISILLSHYKELNLQEVLDHERFKEYAIVHHSSSIEGSTLTEVETRLLLEEDVTPKGKPLAHSLMVKDHYAALRYVLNAAIGKKAISIDFIQQINALVMKNTGSIYNTVFGEISTHSCLRNTENTLSRKLPPILRLCLKKLNRSEKAAAIPCFFNIYDGQSPHPLS